MLADEVEGSQLEIGLVIDLLFVHNPSFDLSPLFELWAQALWDKLVYACILSIREWDLVWVVLSEELAKDSFREDLSALFSEWWFFIDEVVDYKAERPNVILWLVEFAV